MIHHFLHRGHTLEELVNLDGKSKYFMKISMSLFYDEEANRMGVDGSV